jgi:hypothetical protein
MTSIGESSGVRIAKAEFVRGKSRNAKSAVPNWGNFPEVRPDVICFTQIPLKVEEIFQAKMESKLPMKQGE